MCFTYNLHDFLRENNKSCSFVYVNGCLQEFFAESLVILDRCTRFSFGVVGVNFSAGD